MKNRRIGFTLVELMVVVLIVGILAAVAIPIMRGRIDSAKWTEGKAMAGTIATNLRAWAAEHGGDYSSVPGAGDKYGVGAPTLAEMEFQIGEGGDLDGTYFSESDYTWETTWDPANNKVTFWIQVDKAGGINKPDWWKLDSLGTWTNPDSGVPSI
jgi:prepilin-type N-terminal cleavage/methylation domain-containing protein